MKLRWSKTEDYAPFLDLGAIGAKIKSKKRQRLTHKMDKSAFTRWMRRNGVTNDSLVKRLWRKGTDEFGRKLEETTDENDNRILISNDCDAGISESGPEDRLQAQTTQRVRSKKAAAALKAARD